MTATTTTGPGDVRRWLDAYGAAWEERDADRAAALFSESAIYHWGPFEAIEGRAAIRRRWAQATADQQTIRFRSEPLGTADSTAFVHWQVTFTRRSTGEREELDGIFVLRFEADGLCSELREWWRGRDEDTAPAPVP